MTSPHPTGKSGRGFRKFLSEAYRAVLRRSRSPSPSGPQHSREPPSSAAHLSPPSGIIRAAIRQPLQDFNPAPPPTSNLHVPTIQVQPADPNTEYGASNLLDRVSQGVDQVGLKPVLRALHNSATIFPPLRSAIGALIPCLDVLEASSLAWGIL